MKKKAEKPISVEVAVALHLQIEAPCSTAKQCVKKLLESVKMMTNNPRLTLQALKEAIGHWFEQGWATLAGGYLQVTRAGRAKIKAMAEAATAAPEPQPA